MTGENSANRSVGDFDHGEVLEVLAAGRPSEIKACAEIILEGLGDISVLTNRTGLAMLPFQDTVKNTAFHLGEVLIAEAHIKTHDRSVDGYGAVVGRDLEHAMAVAVIDASIAADHEKTRILALLKSEREHLEAADRERLKKVEATRVQMETF